VYDVVIKKFTFAISSPDQFVVTTCCDVWLWNSSIGMHC